MAARSFFADGNGNISVTVLGDSDKKAVVTLSKILQWYAGDFGIDDASRLTRILPYLSPHNQKQLSKVLAHADADITVKYSSYDWTLNA